MTKPAERQDWKTIEISERRTELPFQASFTQREFDQLKLGVVPQQMEDKWFIFFENGWLYFHRSWTGICAYQARFEKRGDEYAIAEALVSLDARESKLDPDVDVGVLSFLIYSILLKRNWAWPQSAKDPKSVADPIEVWSLFGRHMVRAKRKRRFKVTVLL